MRPDIDETLRYLGVQGDAPASLRAQAEALAQELTARVTPRFIWRPLPLRRTGDALLLGSMPLPGQSAARMLADCQQAVILLCTLGAEFDLWLRRLQARDLSAAAVLDALGSAYVEAACDAAEAEIGSRYPTMYLTDRFSPGYGDLPLSLHPALLAAAEARRIGLTCTDTHLMLPQKSVSALIGLADKPQAARIRGCAHCRISKTCPYRKAGITCAF